METERKREREMDMVGQEIILKVHFFLQVGLYLRDFEQISIYPRNGNGIFLP